MPRAQAETRRNITAWAHSAPLEKGKRTGARPGSVAGASSPSPVIRPPLRPSAVPWLPPGQAKPPLLYFNNQKLSICSKNTATVVRAAPIMPESGPGPRHRRAPFAAGATPACISSSRFPRPTAFCSPNWACKSRLAPNGLPGVPRRRLSQGEPDLNPSWVHNLYIRNHGFRNSHPGPVLLQQAKVWDILTAVVQINRVAFAFEKARAYFPGLQRYDGLLFPV